MVCRIWIDADTAITEAPVPRTDGARGLISELYIGMVGIGFPWIGRKGGHGMSIGMYHACVQGVGRASEWSGHR